MNRKDRRREQSLARKKPKALAPTDPIKDFEDLSDYELITITQLADQLKSYLMRVKDTHHSTDWPNTLGELQDSIATVQRLRELDRTMNEALSKMDSPPVD